MAPRSRRQGIVATQAPAGTPSPRSRRLLLASPLLLLAGAILVGLALQSSLVFRWVFLPVLARTLRTEQLEVDDGRFELPARIQIAGLRMRGAGGRFEARAAKLGLALDLSGSQRTRRWIVDELTGDGVEIILRGAPDTEAEEPEERREPRFDAFALDLRRVDLTRVRIERTTSSGAQTTFGPGSFTLRDVVRGAEPNGALSAPVRIRGSDQAEYAGQLDLALRGVLAADRPHLAWQGSGTLRLDPDRPGADARSLVELAGTLHGELGQAMPTLLTLDVRGRQADREAGRLEGTFEASSRETKATLAFTDVSAGLLNPLIVALGLSRLEGGVWGADVKWHAASGSQTFSSRVDVRDLRVRHATGLLGPFLLHSVQEATWDTRAHELEIREFELDLMLNGVSRVRGRLDRPLVLFVPARPGALPSGRTREPARAEVVVQSLPLNELAALGVPVPETLAPGKLNGRATLGVLEAEGEAEYALDLALALPAPRKGSKAPLGNLRRARLELRGRTASQSVEIEAMQLALRSERERIVELVGSGRYGIAAQRMELRGTLDAGRLASKTLWGPLPYERLSALSVESVRGTWQLALDPERARLRSEPRLRGVSGEGAAGTWRLRDVQLALALEARGRAPLRIDELHIRVPEWGNTAELRLNGNADLRIEPPALKLDCAWQAVSLARVRRSGLLPDSLGLEDLIAAVSEGELTAEIQKHARIQGSARFKEARIRVAQRELGPLSSGVDFELRSADGTPSSLRADVALDSKAGPLLRAGIGWPAQSSVPAAYTVNVERLDLGGVRSLLDAGAKADGPVLSGVLRVAAQGAGAPFSFELASAVPRSDRVRGNGTLSPERIAARVQLERVTLDPYVELFDLTAGRPPDRAAASDGRVGAKRPRDGAGAEIRIDAEIGEVAWREVVFQEGALAWTRDRAGSRLELRPKQALGGELSGQVTLTRSGTTRPRLQWELAGDSLRAGQVLRAFGEEDKGVVRGNLRLRSQGEMWLGAGPHEAAGRTELQITNGQFGNSALIDFIATHTRISALRRMRFETLTADLELAGDSVQVLAVDVRAPLAGLAMTGTLDLSGKLDLRVLSRVGPELAQLMSATEYSRIVGGTLDRFLTLPVLILVTGTVRAPSYGVRPTSASVTTAVWDTMLGTGRALRRGSDSIFKR